MLAHLTLKSNFIWERRSGQEPTRYLDGEGFGRPGPDGRVNIVFQLVMVAGAVISRCGSGWHLLYPPIPVPPIPPIFDPIAFPGRTLDEVNGIGPTFRDRLMESGITHPAKVAPLEAARLR